MNTMLFALRLGLLRGWADALWDTGIEFGTLGVGKGDQRLEITTLAPARA